MVTAAPMPKLLPLLFRPGTPLLFVPFSSELVNTVSPRPENSSSSFTPCHPITDAAREETGLRRTPGGNLKVVLQRCAWSRG